MIKGIYHNTPLSELSNKTEKLYLIRPVALKKIKSIKRKCPKLKELLMSQDSYNRLSKKVKNCLVEKEIFIKIEGMRGRAIEVSPRKLFEAIDLYNERMPLRKIGEKLGIPKSTLHYLLRYAQRTKLKDEHGKIVFLEEKI